MKFYKLTYILIFLSFSAIVFTSCEGEEENYNWRAGDQLMINSSDDPEVGSEVSFTVGGYDIRKTYTWAVSGADPTVVSSDGEFFTVIFSAPGNATVSVNDGTDVGEIEVVVAVPEPDEEEPEDGE